VRALFLLLLLSSGLATSGVDAAESPLGRWGTVDEKSGKVKSVVEIYDQGGKLFGRIVSLTEPLNEQGQPKICTKCTGAEKDQPIVGLVIIKDLGPGGDRYKGGTILDPEDGKVYKAEIWTEDGKLRVRGYIGVFYKTQTWVKQK
jgi:uncharacterized protein (DUF2147 family)